MPVLTPAPPTRADPEALIAEARERQRRRRLVLAATVVAVLSALGVIAFALAGHGRNSTAGTKAPGTLVAPMATRFVVGATTNISPGWSGIVVADAAARTCRRVTLPGSFGYVVFSGRRYAYSADGGWSVWRGTLGAGAPHKLRWNYPTGPVWIGNRLALPQERLAERPLLYVGVKAIVLDVPLGARIAGVSASHGRILFQASWGSGAAGNLQVATFLYANGVTTKLRTDPEPNGGVSGGGPTWSPDGSRIAFAEHGDLWTMAPDGGDLVQLTHSPSVPKTGPLLWSADGQTLAYATRVGVKYEVYSVPTDSSALPNRLSESPNVEAGLGVPGTLPLMLLGNGSVAVVTGSTLGVLHPGGTITRMCTIPNAVFYNASALL